MHVRRFESELGYQADRILAVVKAWEELNKHRCEMTKVASSCAAVYKLMNTHC